MKSSHFDDFRFTLHNYYYGAITYVIAGNSRLIFSLENLFVLQVTTLRVIGYTACTRLNES